jgi:hypothetical protein
LTIDGVERDRTTTGSWAFLPLSFASQRPDATIRLATSGLEFEVFERARDVLCRAVIGADHDPSPFLDLHLRLTKLHHDLALV